MASDLIVTMTAADLEDGAPQGDGLTLVDFWAPWCGPCRMVAPILEQLAGDNAGKLTIGKLNIDEYPDAASSFRVASIPTMILFRGGKELTRIIGAQNKRALQETINLYL